MSLNRREWDEMWKAIRTIQQYLQQHMTGPEQREALAEVATIKQQIQSVTGPLTQRPEDVLPGELTDV